MEPNYALDNAHKFIYKVHKMKDKSERKIDFDRKIADAYL